MKPIDDPNADKLTNPNVDTVESTEGEPSAEKPPEQMETVNEGEIQNVEET